MSFLLIQMTNPAGNRVRVPCSRSHETVEQRIARGFEIASDELLKAVRNQGTIEGPFGPVPADVFAARLGAGGTTARQIGAAELALLVGPVIEEVAVPALPAPPPATHAEDLARLGGAEAASIAAAKEEKAAAPPTTEAPPTP